MKAFIIAPLKDIHAISVRWGLAKLNARVCIWPTISNNKKLTYELSSSNWFLDRSNTVGSAIWIRRPQKPTLHPKIAKHDLRFTYEEQVYCLKSFLISARDNSAFVINDYLAEEKIDKKPLQLTLAQSSGFFLPETILTNDPKTARVFAKKVMNRIVCKSLLPHFWEDATNNRVSAARTFLLDKKLLEDDFNVEACPILLQEYVEKIYDIRMIVMGRAFIAAKINITKEKAKLSDSIDWRSYAQLDAISLEEINIPDSIKESTIRFMNASGIVFGCFDFSVDKFGRWWFLEVNPGGQFLWMDEYNLNVSLLETFCNFIYQRDPLFSKLYYGNEINMHFFKKSKDYRLHLSKKVEHTDRNFVSLMEENI